MSESSSPGEDTSVSSDSKKEKQKKKKRNSNKNLLSSVPNDEEVDHDSQQERHQSRIFLLDGTFEISQLTRDPWLDHRRSVQNGSRCIRCDSHNKRYMCTARSLRDWEDNESKRAIKNFNDVFQAQSELALLTPFVQSVVAAKVHRRDLLVITQLPSNMYLCDFKKLVVHLPHSSIRYYAACILLGLEFMRHRKIYHGNLSLTSIALDHYGRPQITDFDATLQEKLGRLSYQLDALRFGALLGVLHCDNIRHFSVSHMRSAVSDSWRRDVFSGICPKCRLTMECVEPKLCDCNNFGALIRLIRGKIAPTDVIRRIQDHLSSTWVEADLRYSWSCIPKFEDKLSEQDIARGPSQQLDGHLDETRSRMSRISDIAPYSEYDNGSDASFEPRQSRISLDVLSSLAGTGTARDSRSQAGYSTASVWTEANKAMEVERDWQRYQVLQQSRVDSTSTSTAKPTRVELMGLSSESLPNYSLDSVARLESGLNLASPPAPREAMTQKSKSNSASMLELSTSPSKHPQQTVTLEQLDKSMEQPQTPPGSLDSTPPIPKPRSKMAQTPALADKHSPPTPSSLLTLQKQWPFSKLRKLRKSRLGSILQQAAKHTKVELMGWTSESLSSSDSKSVLCGSVPDLTLQPAPTESGTPKLLSNSASMLELSTGHLSKRPPQSVALEQLDKCQDQPQAPLVPLDSTPLFPKARSKKSQTPTPPSKPSPLPPLSSPPLSSQHNWKFSKFMNIDSSEDGSPTQVKNSTDTEPQSSSSCMLGQGIVSFNTVDEYDHKEENLNDNQNKANHNQAAVNSSDTTEQKQNSPLVEKKTPAAATEVGKLASKEGNPDEQLDEFAFDGYQQMMRQTYFNGINWAALDTAQPPEGFCFSHSLILQSYSRETAPPRVTDNIGKEFDRVIGSHFTSRSRILYNLFG